MHAQGSKSKLRIDEIDFRKVFLLMILAVALVGGVFGAYRFVHNYFELKAYKDDRDVELLKSKLSAHFTLPKEEPIVATVTDVAKLQKEQPFYKNARNGDKVFIWKDKALIYRVTDDKIVDFGIIVNKAALEAQQPEQQNASASGDTRDTN